MFLQFYFHHFGYLYILLIYSAYIQTLFFRAVLTLQSDQEDGIETLSSHMHIDSPINNIIHQNGTFFFHQG